MILKKQKFLVGSNIEENLDGRKSPIFVLLFLPKVWDDRLIILAMERRF